MAMKKKGLAIAAAAGLLLAAESVSAHCPLCTLGAAAAAGGAAYLGVSHIVIGVFIGAFAVSTGWWFAKLIKKRFIPLQMPAIILASYLMTVIPMMPMLSEQHGLYIPWVGQYGTVLMLDYFLIGTIVGGVILCITPWLSRQVSALRDGRIIPYQGIALTFGLLLLAGVILQLVA